MAISNSFLFEVSFVATGVFDGTLLQTPSLGAILPAASSKKLAFAQQPRAAEVGAVIAPFSVEVDDSSNHVVTSDDSDITVSIGSGAKSAVLSGTLTVPAINGVATFSDLSVNEEGTFVLRVSDSGLKAGTSRRFLLKPLLAWEEEPDRAIAGSATTPPLTVELEGATAQLVRNDQSIVNLRVLSGPTGGQAVRLTQEP